MVALCSVVIIATYCQGFAGETSIAAHMSLSRPLHAITRRQNIGWSTQVNLKAVYWRERTNTFLPQMKVYPEAAVQKEAYTESKQDWSND